LQFCCGRVAPFLPTIEGSAATKDGENVVDVPVECADQACRPSMPADSLLEEVAGSGAWRR
jgi:hypothetical protein